MNFDLDEIERRMRPGIMSRAGFLGPHESLRDVLSQDAAVLDAIGLTFEDLARRLQSVLSGEDAPSALRVRVTKFLGPQICPWSPNSAYIECAGIGAEFASLDWTIANLETGQSLRGPGLIVHLLHDHHFAEGRQSPYRVDPEALARLLGLVP